MDTLRGTFDRDNTIDEGDDFDLGHEDVGAQVPPASIGQDERRMQVRAYNHWASLLGDNNFPSIEELELGDLPDFGPHSVLLDFSVGIEDPAVRYIGDDLAEECDAGEGIDILSDVPSRSLLSRITDHYMQILANEAPIGFEAEFVNQRGATILYRGILLPFSSNNETIDFIYGVINWKELADQATTDALLLEIDQALEQNASEESPLADPQVRAPEPLAQWADSPSAEFAAGSEEDALPQPDFGQYQLDDEDEDEDAELDVNYGFASLTDHIAAPVEKADALDLSSFEAAGDEFEAEFDTEEVGFEAEHAADIAPMDLGAFADAPLREAPSQEAIVPDDLPDNLPEDAGLYDTLAAARELAHTARSSEDRSRKALYAAVGRAYDVSIAADESPEEYNELVADNGLSVQERAPMTPIVKLVFGADYDKTRLTEYAAVLNHAHRVGVERGHLATFLKDAQGGLKAVVSTERELRREESGKPVTAKDAPGAALAKKLRKLEGQSLDAIDADGAEFALVMIRRNADGEVVMLGEIADDIALVERVGRKLVD